VNTPTKKSGIGAGKAADLTYWESAARQIAKNSSSSKIVVEKSTVPVRTAEAMSKVLERNKRDDTIQFSILSNPEFLAEGTAIADLLRPDRVLIGGKCDTDAGADATEALADVYREWVQSSRVLTSNLWSAELSKLTANAFLAQRISSINSISALCEATGADVTQVAKSVGFDSRVGNKFLKASVGFGGSCFKKDILNLVYICESNGLQEVADYWRHVVSMNQWQKERFVHRIVSGMFNTVRDKRIAILGFAFKKDTGDTRETPAIDICKQLIDDGARLAIYDPKVTTSQIRFDLSAEQFAWDHPHTKLPDVRNNSSAADRVECCNSVMEAATGADAICIITEWDEFKTVDYQQVFNLMRKPAFAFDGRNILDHQSLRSMGFIMYAIGKPLHSFFFSSSSATQ
jgi:UDPglucose 6-dehydrogenase